MAKKRQKSTTQDLQTDIELTDAAEVEEQPIPVEPEEDVQQVVRKGKKTKLTDAEIDAPYRLVIENGDAAKLSPKSPGKIMYHLGVNPEGELYIRIVSNESGGLFSKEWVSVSAIVALLKQQGDKTFKSSLFKQVINGKSSNNASFLASVLRTQAIGFITPSEKGTFLHERAANLDEQFESLKVSAS